MNILITGGGKRIGKEAMKQMDYTGLLTSYLIEIFKNHKLIKIFQKEKYEKQRADNYLESLKEAQRKMTIVGPISAARYLV